MSNTNNNIRSEIKLVAQVIETLAQQVQAGLDKGADIIPTANELARNASTFVFTLGALYATELSGKTTTKSKSRKTTVVSNPNQTKATNTSYFNHRDSLGRFARV